MVPPCALVFCETAFLNRIGLSARIATPEYALRQMDIVEMVIDSAASAIELLPTTLDFIMMMRNRAGSAPVADQFCVVTSYKKGDLWQIAKKHPRFRFVALRVPKHKMPLLRAVANTLGVSTREALVFLLSCTFHAQRDSRVGLMEMTYLGIINAYNPASA